jgi:4-carboxymuconolactone decarboxylase
MAFHFPRAIENGVTQEDLVELITHLAFYAGWPNAIAAATRAKELLAKK